MLIDSPVQEHDEQRGIRVFYIRLGKEDEPALWIQRDMWGKSNAYVLPLNQAYLLDDDSTLMEKAFIAARELGMQLYKSEIHFLMDLLLKHIDGLVQKIPPKKAETRLDIENQMERMGISGLSINGESLI